MKVNASKRARRQIESIDAWWRQHRDKAPDLFKEELAEAEAFLSNTPQFARVYVKRGPRTIRWLLLPKTAVKLYFWVEENAATVHVIAAWGGRRGHEPKL